MQEKKLISILLSHLDETLLKKKTFRDFNKECSKFRKVSKNWNTIFRKKFKCSCMWMYLYESDFKD